MYFKTFSSSHSEILLSQGLFGFSSNDLISDWPFLKSKFGGAQEDSSEVLTNSNIGNLGKSMKLIGEDDETSVGTSILLENDADSGDDSYLLTEDYIVGDYVQDKTAQNELFDKLDDNVLDFSESNPFGDAGVFA